MEPIPGHHYLGQEPRTRQLIGPRGEPTTKIMLKEHSIKPLLTYHYTHRQVHLSVLIIGAPFCSRR